jgi:hypothetical protein
MAKRRDFIKKSVIGTAGIAVGGLGLSSKASASEKPVMIVPLPQPEKDWHTDPEWRRVKYGEWGGPGVSA